LYKLAKAGIIRTRASLIFPSSSKGVIGLPPNPVAARIAADCTIYTSDLTRVQVFVRALPRVLRALGLELSADGATLRPLPETSNPQG
jgi:hypothetical protein